MLHSFQQIIIEDPVDQIIRQIRQLILSGQLQKGDKLPSERKLAERLSVGRSHVRDALNKLEFYGILRTLPQSGRVIEGLGISALEGIITDVLHIQNCSLYELVETRVVIEKQTAAMAAERRTSDDIGKIESALNAYSIKVDQGLSGVEEDLLFHQSISDAAHNVVLHSLMLIITPDIARNFTELNVCENGKMYSSFEQHKIILEHIINQNPESASRAMEEHLQDVLEYANRLQVDATLKNVYPVDH